ncbi:kinase-like protein [Pseudovirgaria hyperparasitica]|uniref:non-specific serine/threonine protein kinase n=1 Tax=Pseudovirgaria hyperparasitica TaxID=470096 RepID=A0A6A6VXY5_9PEZI|nr:kinase-like protein [Pseudovirgaria hyperparasitica]KAF2754137.1 kinase-like protein [Pseudovirgaria hyperparasitica]
MSNTRASLMVPRPNAGTKLRQIEQAKEMQRIVEERAARTSVDPPPYDFLQFIGRGSFGRVYKCKHRNTQEVVAVKITEVDDADYQAYFEDKDRSLPDLIREIKVLQQLKETRASPYVNVIYDAFPMYSELWMVTEYCPGGSVTTLMKPNPAGQGLEEKYIVAIARELATALKYVHEANVIHRDIKCGNVLITEDGNLQLGDFGVSGVLETEVAKRSTIVGTLHWMPPELLGANLSSNYKYPVAPLYRHEVDIWAFGCTVYEMAMGHGPMSTARTLPELAATAQERPPRLEGDRFSEGLKSLVAFCIEANPEDRPTADAILQHDYLRDTSRSHPTSSLRELIERYVIWEASGGSRASLFNPQMGAAHPELPLPQDDDDEDWSFSMSDELDDEYAINLDDEPTTKAATKGVLNTAFSMPKSKKERESMVRRGGEGLQRLFDPDSTPYIYGTSDLALRQYDTEGGNNRETIIDLDDVEPAFNMPTLDLGDVPTLRANRLNKEALDRVIAELKEEDDMEARSFARKSMQQDNDYTKRATRDWKFPSMLPPETSIAPPETDNRRTQDWTFASAMPADNRRTQDWTFASAMAEADPGHGQARNRMTREIQTHLLTAPAADIANNRRTRDFVFPSQDPPENTETDVVDFVGPPQPRYEHSARVEFQRPTLRHAATQPTSTPDGTFGQQMSVSDSPPRMSMIDLDFALPTEWQPRPATSGSGGDGAPLGVEYGHKDPFDLEDQVQLSESNNRLSFHTKSQSEPTKALPGLLTPSDQQADAKRGSKYGVHSRGTSQANLPVGQPARLMNQPSNQRRFRRRQFRREASSVSSRSYTSASETEPEDDYERGRPSSVQPGFLQNSFWSNFNPANRTPSDWNKSVLSRSNSIASRGDMSGIESDAMDDDRFHPFRQDPNPFGEDCMSLNPALYTTPPNNNARTSANAFINNVRPTVPFPLPTGPHPESLKHDSDPDLVEHEFQRVCKEFLYGLKVCKDIVEHRQSGVSTRGGTVRMSTSVHDEYAGLSTDSEGIAL